MTGRCLRLHDFSQPSTSICLRSNPTRTQTLTRPRIHRCAYGRLRHFHCRIQSTFFYHRFFCMMMIPQIRELVPDMPLCELLAVGHLTQIPIFFVGHGAINKSNRKLRGANGIGPYLLFVRDDSLVPKASNGKQEHMYPDAYTLTTHRSFVPFICHFPFCSNPMVFRFYTNDRARTFSSRWW